MYSKALLLLLLWAATSASSARVVVLSSTCLSKFGGGLVSALSCPADASRIPESRQELHNDVVTADGEQRFCCGPPDARYCCDFDQKVMEDPAFDPSYPSTMDYYDDDGGGQQGANQDLVFTYHDSAHYWHVFLVLAFGVFCTFIILYFFGTIILGLLECFYLALCAKNNRVRPSPSKPYRPSPSAAETATLTPMPGPVYNAISSGPPDSGSGLYRDVTPGAAAGSGQQQNPPSYEALTKFSK